MKSAIGQKLQELVTDYYHGLVTFESYRAQRGQFLDLLTAGEFEDIDSDETQQRRKPAFADEPDLAAADDDAATDEVEVLVVGPPPVELAAPADPGPEAEQAAVLAAGQAAGPEVEPASGPDTDTGAPTSPGAAPTSPGAAPARPEPAPTTSSRKGLWLGAAAAVLLGVTVAGVVMMPGGETPVADPPVAASPVAGSAPELSAGEALIEELLARGNWDASDALAFADRWDALPADERALGQASTLYGRLSETVQRRLQEEQALSGAGASPELLAMLGFAERMGFAYAARLRALLPARDTTEAPAAAVEAVPAAPDESAEPDTAPDAPPTQVGPSDGDPVESPPDAVQTSTAPASDAEPTPQSAEVVPAPPPPAVDLEAAETAPPVTADAAEPAESPAQADEPAAAQAPPAATDGDPCRAVYTDRPRRPLCQDTLAGGGTGPQLVVVPAGQFTMGSAVEAQESPTRTVMIGTEYALSVHEVSAGEFAQFCAATGFACGQQVWQGDDYPITNVSWHDAIAYTEWLSAATGYRYGLPSEAQWEYAARAGTDTPYFFGDEITPSYAHSTVNGPIDAPAARGGRAINDNAFLLMHMAGNVREWVADAWHENYENAPVDGSVWAGGNSMRRVVRGGSYEDGADRLRSAARGWSAPDTRDPLTGFRVLREVEP